MSTPLRGTEAFYRLVRNTLFVIYRVLFGFRHYGSEKVPEPNDTRGVILAPNHVSHLDPPVTGISLKRRVTYLAKDYLFKHWFVGWILRGIGAYPIKSDSVNDFRSIRDLIRILKQGECVTVFPEGTRSENGEFREPEAGLGFLALKSGAWVVPAYIGGTFEALPKGAEKIKRCLVDVHYGTPFLPVEIKDLPSGEEGYLKVVQRIMAEIKEIKAGLRQQTP